MSRLKKRVRKSLPWVLGAAAVFLVAVAALSLLARKYVSVEGLVRLAEGEINSRVHIGEAELSLFRFPAIRPLAAFLETTATASGQASTASQPQREAKSGRLGMRERMKKQRQSFAARRPSRSPRFGGAR